MSKRSSLPVDSPQVGLVAGWGQYPIVVAQLLQDQGYQVFCLGIKDHADPILAAICHDFCQVGLGKLGAAIRYFRSRGIRQATMAGKIHKVLLFQRSAWRHFPDWRCIRTFYPHYVTLTKDRKDDTMLGAVVNAYAQDGIVFSPATDFAPELLVKFGHLGGPRLSRSQRKDIQFGWNLATEMGRLDVGQSVAVKGRAVLAVEAVEGTDECIRRAGKLCPTGGFTVVKVAKPQQDMRFDVPTIGAGTVRAIAESGGRVLAVQADKTIIIDQPVVAGLANQLKIAVVALHDGTSKSLADAA